jgi:hypothetical protein
MSRKPRKSTPSSDPSSQNENREPDEQDVASSNGGVAEETEAETVVATQEEPAQVQLTIKGSDKSARAAAKRFGGEMAKHLPVSTPSNEPDVPDDPISDLLSDGKNMVIVTRQKPRVVQGPDGKDVATNLRIRGRFTCPTTKAEIEELVFEKEGGSKYKCTIHPDTTEGENKILGHFTIEHPDPHEPPYIEGVTINVPEPEREIDIPTGDPTMRETDGLAKLRQDAERRVERARILKETRELEREAKRLEDEIEQPNRSAQTAESDELRKMREENERLRRDMEAKKTDDRFAAMQGSIADLTKVVSELLRAPARQPGEDPTMKFMLEKMKSDDARFAEMMKALTEKQKPPTTPAETGDPMDKMLDRFQKFQAITGTAPNKGVGRLSEIENKLIDMSMDRLMNGVGGGEEATDEDNVEDLEGALKLAIKQFAPIAKTYVEKKMDQETAASGGAPLSKEQLQRVYAEASNAAARKVQEDLAAQGYQLAQDPRTGKLVALPLTPGVKPPVVPPRQLASRVVSTTKTSEGVVKKVALEPHDLRQKPKVAAQPPPAPEPEPQKEEEDVKNGVFPMLGANGETVKIPFPIRPGEMKYDRKYSVNFVLDGIRSELRQGNPQKALTQAKIETYVVEDALDFLDDEMLDQLDGVDSGEKLETLLSPWGDADKIAEIKKAGEDENVASYLRRLFLSIQREWQGVKKTK